MTIREIANTLRVSTATVSNVIHGHLEKMSPETAQCVREKLEQYHFFLFQKHFVVSGLADSSVKG